MSRLRRAWQAFTTADAKHAVVATNPRARGEVTPYRTVNRDRVMEATIARPGARQVWQLHRVREDSRDLEIRSSIWGGWVRFARIQAIGYELSRLQFDGMTDEQATRLAEPVRYLRKQWRRQQKIRHMGGAGQTIHQLAGQVLHHVLVDGDCFVTRRRGPKGTIWDLHAGDALAESENALQLGSDESVILGVVQDPYGNPIAYLFNDGGRPAQANFTIATYASTVAVMRVPAAGVLHIRDRSGDSTIARGWPRCTTVLDEIARLNEFDEAFVRSATLRASIGVFLEQELFAAGAADGGRGPGDFARTTGEGGFTTENPGNAEGELVRPYQEFAAKAGTFTELDPGYTAKKIDTGNPTADEAAVLAKLLQRVCAALRTTPATLLGDYSSLSFSAGQLGHMQERQAVEDMQMVLVNQLYEPLYEDFVRARWVALVAEFPAIDPTEDFEALWYPSIRLKKYQILDKGRLVVGLLKAWEAGMYTYAEVREELGASGENADEVIAQWKKDRAALGLPESPTQAGGGMMPGESKDDKDDDPDKKSKDGDDGDD